MWGFLILILKLSLSSLIMLYSLCALILYTQLEITFVAELHLTVQNYVSGRLIKSSLSIRMQLKI